MRALAKDRRAALAREAARPGSPDGRERVSIEASLSAAHTRAADSRMGQADGLDGVPS